MQRDVGLVADDPAIVARWAGRNVEQSAGAQFVDGAVVHRGGSAAGEDQADVFDIATRGADGGADVQGPAPARFVGGAPDGHAAEADEFEFAFIEGADFVRGFEAFQDCVEHWRHASSRFQDSATPGIILARMTFRRSGARLFLRKTFRPKWVERFSLVLPTTGLRALG